MGKRIVIAGASGALGRAVARALKRRGWAVRALVRDAGRLGPDEGLFEEVRTGDALLPASLRGAFDGADAVFSSVGASVLPHFRGWRGFMAVDLPANRNLVREAERAGVGRFAYVSVFHHSHMRRLAYVRAHEEVADLIGSSRLTPTIIRPTGFYSAIGGAYLELAKNGAVPLIGDGSTRSNPIDDGDLAEASAEAIDAGQAERAVGGPEVHTRRDMSDLAFAAVGRAPRYRRMPIGLARPVGLLMKPLHPRLADFFRFLVALSENDLVAPAYGTRKLADHFARVAQAA
jgi:uncharacterized protein YbjT (DUF2867 family)